MKWNIALILNCTTFFFWNTGSIFKSRFLFDWYQLLFHLSHVTLYIQTLEDQLAQLQPSLPVSTSPPPPPPLVFSHYHVQPTIVYPFLCSFLYLTSSHYTSTVMSSCHITRPLYHHHVISLQLCQVLFLSLSMSHYHGEQHTWPMPGKFYILCLSTEY